jgi:hypothetical protein
MTSFLPITIVKDSRWSDDVIMQVTTMRASSNEQLMLAHPLLLSRTAVTGQHHPLLLYDHSSDRIVAACCFPVVIVSYGLQL